MTKFIYEAKDREGKLVEGLKEADSTKEVVQMLHSKGLITISVKEAGERVSEKKKKAKIVKGRKIKLKNIAIFSRQLATMVGAGVSIVDAINDLSQMMSNVKFQNVLSKVAEDIKAGRSLSEALENHPDVFKRIFVSMVKAGEESGNLDIVLNDLAIYLEKGIKLRAQVKAASMYPMVVGVFFGVVVAGLVLFLVPRFKEMFASFGAEMPLPTRIMMGISDIAVKNLLWIILTLIGLSIIIKAGARTRAGRCKIDSLKLKLPIFGALLTKVVLARFFQALSTLLRSGVDVIASLEVAAKVIDNIPVEDIIKNVRIKILAGSSLSLEMDTYSFFPRMTVRMVAVGEKSGKLDELLLKVSEYYTDEVDTAVAGLSSIIEPVLIIFLGVFVGVFVISMYLPIFKMAVAMTGGG